MNGREHEKKVVPKREAVVRTEYSRRNMLSVLIVLLTIIEFGTIPQQQIGFYCNDPKISYKFIGDTIPISILIGGSIVIPFVVMWIAEYTCHSVDSYDPATGCAGSRTKQIWIWYGQYAIGIISLTFICDVMKVIIGEPRPHFLDTCKPREADNCTDEYVRFYTCTNTLDSDWFVSDSSKSFPSGHSALSIYTTIFVVWYLQNRLPNRRPVLLRPWLQSMMCMWAVACSLTRIGDNRHHWWDVLAGDVLGAIFAVLTVRVPCRKFRVEKNSFPQTCMEPIENGQISFGDKRHQSVKKLLTDSPADVSEGRELKNISAPWKE
ncbi:hypothetical protein KM043_015872 [Ampulex compressa]|nr:hypothetical protein KM043_015872 [Ampulex compressa]